MRERGVGVGPREEMGHPTNAKIGWIRVTTVGITAAIPPSPPLSLPLLLIRISTFPIESDRERERGGDISGFYPVTHIALSVFKGPPLTPPHMHKYV